MRYRRLFMGTFLLMVMICFSMRYVKAEMTADASDIYSESSGSDNAANGQLVQEAERVCALINQQRASVGEAVLIRDDRLMVTSSVRAAELTTLFSHTRPNGQLWWTVENDLNYYDLCYGEIVAYGQHSADEVVYDWITSPSHLRTMDSKEFTRIGAAIAENSNGVLYWAVMFY